MWDTSPDLLLVLDGHGCCRRANPAWRTLLGIAQPALTGHTVDEFLQAEDGGSALEAMRQAAAGRLASAETRRRHTDGGMRSISWVAAPAGEMLYATGRDVTGERERAGQLAEAQDALRQSQKMEAVGQLTCGLAHDFNNLLAGISGSLELIEYRAQKGQFEDIGRYLYVARNGVRRAAALDPKPADVNRLVADLHELIERTVGPGIAVEVVGASQLWPAMVDASQLENALLNLCINARDAMPGSGRITIETANRSTSR